MPHVGGTSGNVVANRLSENSYHSVLVLEAGGSINYPRGFGLGGGSAVNFMVYTRGSKEDYNRWAKVTLDDGRSWDRLVPYRDKNERFGSPSDHHNTTEQFNPAVHGLNGITTGSLAGFPNYPFNLDMNSGYPLGIGWGQATIKNGSRSSSATSYLAPHFVVRPNLHVLLRATVTRVLPTIANAFRTVEFVQDLKDPRFLTSDPGKRFTLTARKGIILSTGSIGTPNILLHSGIGNSLTLASLGIKPVHNLPSVGKNLSDHSILFMGFLVNSNDTYDAMERNTTLAAEHSDLAAGPNTPHYEPLISNGLLGRELPPTGNFLGVTPSVSSPTSRGSVTLGSSSDALAPPVINPNLLGSEFDILVMRDAVKSALHFTAAPAWKDYVITPVGVNQTSTDAEIDDFVRENAGTVFHPVGTAREEPAGEWLKGLRIVGLSIVPFIPAAHPQAAAYVIGERASDLIKQSWN
ncbi:hypothetical protein B0H19DRAFT_1206246 [Mycena capillaripes]|nr:hypothetical protein B0H19DRAFT_1206246 [Mycena capillaripes]